jgi:alkanesulfonate monooxygenase SsuD/methylene tetrahydromethanopterin reductase-like flavin-dependent oxidoreductase (luciferase family)
VWAGDSLLAKPRAEPITLLAGVATVTERVELGTAVMLSAMRNSAQLAQAVATADALSGGRLILGVGGGPGGAAVQADFERVGVDFERRSSRSVWVMEQARALWSGSAGEQMYPLPGRPTGPPIWIGGAGPRTLERAAKHADGWFPISATVEEFSSGLARVREVAEEVGRTPSDLTIAVYLTVNIGEQTQAQAALEEHSELYYGVAHETISKFQGSTAGDADHVGEWLRTFIDAGAEHLCIRFASSAPQAQLEQLAVIADQLRSKL